MHGNVRAPRRSVVLRERKKLCQTYGASMGREVHAPLGGVRKELRRQHVVGPKHELIVDRLRGKGRNRRAAEWNQSGPHRRQGAR